jgi:hypothetical protein
VDCGASCPKCIAGQACGVASDCQSLRCVGGVCQTATCSDSVKNGSESDVDCGGGGCAKCGAGKTCTGASNCASGVCTGGKCQAPTCTDQVTNGAETSTDCGGGT